MCDQYVDSRASNHMTNHEEYVSYLEKPEQSGVELLPIPSS